MAGASRGHRQAPTRARVRMDPDGYAVVQSDMTDIGTGTYTILTQIAADALGLPVDRVRVELGRSEFPQSWGSGGSWGASNSGTAVLRACEALREKVLASARDKSEPLSKIVGRDHPQGVEAEGEP